MNASIHYTEPTIHPDWINTPAGLNKLINVLSNESLVAVDTESDSLYSYFEKVCLIQFSTQHNDYLVDPLAVDISDLAPFFADELFRNVGLYDVGCGKLGCCLILGQGE